MKEKPILLGDYINEYENLHTVIFLQREAAKLSVEEIFDLSTISRQEIRAALAIRIIRTVAERYAPGSDQAIRHEKVELIQEDAELIQEIAGQLEKITRLDELAAQANACENTEFYRRSYHEAMKLVFGDARKGKL